MSLTKEPDKKSLKEQRVRSYFVTAAKEIILSEGLENVTVRKVADRAGYAFSTIYKHYKDLEALLLDVKLSMIEDLLTYMQEMMPQSITSTDDIKKLNRIYAEYFIEHPHVFSFFYSSRINPDSQQPVTLPDFAPHWQRTFASFAHMGSLRAEDIPIFSKTIIYSLQGLLSLYFSGYGMTADILYEELYRIVDFLLGGR